MSADPPSPHLSRLWMVAQVVAVIVTITGFAPTRWIENLFSYMKLPDGIGDDYRLFAVGAGVAIITASMLVRMWSRPVQFPATASANEPILDVAATKLIEDIDDIARKPSIAVLPFVNLSSDKEQEFFADGMTEDIITGLSCDSRLFVIARNSTFVYKGKPVDIRAVGKELGVRYVLEGSIRPIGERLRISVQLIDATSGAHVWADKIDRPVAEIFDIMDEVVDGLVISLCSNLRVAEGKRAARARPEDLQAWALCVQAETVYWSQPDAKSTVAAEKLLRRAVEIEPGYGASWAILALLLSSRVAVGGSADLAKDLDEARSHASKALLLAPYDPLVLGYCGCSYILAGQTTQAIDCLERSLEANPNSALFRPYYAGALWADGRPGAGIVQLDLSFRLSPKDPNAGMAYHFYADCYLALGDFAKAEQSSLNAIKLMPGFWFGYLHLAMSQAGLGRADEALQQIRKVCQMAPALTRQSMENTWLLVFRKPEQAEKFIALLRQAWPD